jgi:hypothetical protein
LVADFSHGEIVGWRRIAVLRISSAGNLDTEDDFSASALSLNGVGILINR